MPNGTIVRLLSDKGFGFISDEGGTEHFFHESSVPDGVFQTLREGQKVEFELTPGRDGKSSAENLSIIE